MQQSTEEIVKNKGQLIEKFKNTTDEEKVELLQRYIEKAKKTFPKSLVDLRGLDLSCLNLSELQLCYVDLEGANLERTCCWKANFSGSNLKGVNFKNSDLRFTVFYRANLYKVNFTSATLQYTNFSAANLEGARLVNNDIDGSIFQETNLKNTIFSSIHHVKSEQLSEAHNLDKIKIWFPNAEIITEFQQKVMRANRCFEKIWISAMKEKNRKAFLFINSSRAIREVSIHPNRRDTIIFDIKLKSNQNEKKAYQFPGDLLGEIMDFTTERIHSYREKILAQEQQRPSHSR